MHVMRMIPDESTIFFGDTARTPYGSKSPKTIRQFSMQIADFLMSKNVKMIVTACNTVSANALEDLRFHFPQIPVIGCISPTAREIVKCCSPADRIGIMATRATVKSNVYADKIKSLAPELATYQIACPALVPLIEESIIENDIMDLTLRYYLDDFIRDNRINKMVLGCTHYPLVLANLKRLYPQMTFYSSSHELATAVGMELDKYEIKAENEFPQHVFYASDLSEGFATMIENLTLGTDDNADVEFMNLDI